MALRGHAWQHTVSRRTRAVLPCRRQQRRRVLGLTSTTQARGWRIWCLGWCVREVELSKQLERLCLCLQRRRQPACSRVGPREREREGGSCSCAPSSTGRRGGENLVHDGLSCPLVWQGPKQPDRLVASLQRRGQNPRFEAASSCRSCALVQGEARTGEGAAAQPAAPASCSAVARVAVPWICLLPALRLGMVTSALVEATWTAARPACFLLVQILPPSA